MSKIQRNSSDFATLNSKAQVDPQQVSYIEVHGTGTELGDPVEVDALKAAFDELSQGQEKDLKENFCGLGSVKTNIGHLESYRNPM